jgi:hypothetical protein
MNHRPDYNHIAGTVFLFASRLLGREAGRRQRAGIRQVQERGRGGRKDGPRFAREGGDGGGRDMRQSEPLLDDPSFYDFAEPPSIYTGRQSFSICHVAS